MKIHPPYPRRKERGNVLFIILIAVVLIGALTAAVQRSNNSESAGIDDEALAIKASEVQAYMAELERAVTYIMQNGASESDIRFSVPDGAATDYGDLAAAGDTSVEVFHPDGGAAHYRTAPAIISTSAWEFTGHVHMPGVGTPARADLLAVLPSVTEQFCTRINRLNNQTASPASTTCPFTAAGRFDGGTGFDDSSPETMTEATFSTTPAMQACVTCGGNRYFYHVLMAR